MNRALAKPRLRILGPIEAWSDDRWLDLGGPRQVALLAYLLVHANQAVPSDVLLEALWGPTPCGADNRLQMAVARLRKSLSPLNGSAGLVLRTVGGGYLLSLGPNQLDAELFMARVRDGLRAAQKEEPQSAGGSRTHRRIERDRTRHHLIIFQMVTAAVGVQLLGRSDRRRRAGPEGRQLGRPSIRNRDQRPTEASRICMVRPADVSIERELLRFELVGER